MSFIYFKALKLNWKNKVILNYRPINPHARIMNADCIFQLQRTRSCYSRDGTYGLF
jgi:hypothetical protein